MNSVAEVEKISKDNPNALNKSEASTTDTDADSRYARYVLFVLLLVYTLNFLDRQLLVILAEDIKADLGVSDGQMGFLFGTAFAVFYAVFGIAFGRLADTWNRVKLISLGLSVWSLMTALSGLTRSFLPLAACRFGVGIGEASASPAAFSLLYDYFPPKVRTTVLAVYSLGAVIGGGLGIFLGGTILDAWHSAWPDPSLAPFGLKGWQAAFMLVGMPGLLMALWVMTLREPPRGQNDGLVSESHPHPFREALAVLISMLPITNLWFFAQSVEGRRIIPFNLAAGFTLVLLMFGLIQLTGSIEQWVAVGIAFYAVTSWAQMLAIRDPVIFSMIFRCKALIFTVLGLSVTLLGAGGAGFWSIPFIQRYHGVSASDVGTILGLGGIVVGIVGVVVGGMLADKLRTRTAKGKLYVVLGGLTVSSLAILLLYTTHQLPVVYGASFLSGFSTSLILGPVVSTINDLVLPRARGTASAFYFMMSILMGSTLAPYLVGHLSDVMAATGSDSGEALRQSVLWLLLLVIPGLAILCLAIRHIEADEASLLDRARGLGEKV